MKSQIINKIEIIVQFIYQSIIILNASVIVYIACITNSPLLTSLICLSVLLLLQSILMFYSQMKKGENN